MKKKYLIPIALAVCLLLGACTPLKKLRDISFEGTNLTVVLGVNLATGHKWKYAIDGDCIRADIGGELKIKGVTKAEDHNVFEGLSEGSATIVFTAPVDWDGEGNGETFVVSVSVGTDGTILSAEEAGEE